MVMIDPEHASRHVGSQAHHACYPRRRMPLEDAYFASEVLLVQPHPIQLVASHQPSSPRHQGALRREAPPVLCETQFLS